MKAKFFTCTNGFYIRSTICCIVLIISIFHSFCSTAQQLNPPIQNYSSIAYDAASQNWDISIDETGMIYVANNRGLLIFNGQTWKLFSLNSGAIIRSVYAYKGKIFTGSYREFGYWERNDMGGYSYHSLNPLFKDIALGDEEFWGIMAYNDSIYFRSFGALYKYDGDKIIKISNGVFTGMKVFQNKLWVAKGRDGIFFLNHADKLQFFEPSLKLTGNTIADLEVHNDQLIAGTREQIFYLDKKNDEFNLMPGNLNDAIEKSELNKILSLDHENLIIGTLKNGFLKWNRNNEGIQVFNRSNGLQNNTVLALDVFKGQLWLGLDNGIDRMDIDSPIKFYTNTTGELGAVYDLIKESNKIYLASNTGVYFLDESGLRLIEGGEGHSWNLAKIGDKVISNSNSSTFEILNNKLKILDNSTGSFHTTLSPKNQILVGTYTGIGVVTDSSFYKIDNIGFPVKKMVFENENVLWAAHPYEGIYRVQFSEKLNKAVRVQDVPSLDSLKHFNSQIYSINNQIAVYSNQNWYRYNVFKDRLEVFEELRDLKGFKLLEEHDSKYWFINTQSDDLFFTNLKDQEFSLPAWRLENRLVKGYEQMTAVSDSIYYICLKDGFARVDLAALMKEQHQLFIAEPFVAGFQDANKTYSLMEKPNIPHKHASLVTLDLGLPFSDSRNIAYRLVGNDTVSGIVENGELIFQNLDYGDYSLEIYPFGTNGKDFKTFEFTVLPPWYLSFWMKGIYMLLFISGVGLIFLYNRRRLKKHQLIIEQKFEKEHKERIVRLERERLMDEIDMKRKELANTTMMAAKKNEVLMEIQGELNKDKAKINEYRLKHIMNKINGAVKSKDEWQVFETNFNEIHEDFFKDVLDAYPNLTSKDLKLCSYLKMNLTSKEIAPLMGISVRGVEVHRYRLRKKMDLDKTENLTNFLIKKF